MKNTLFITNLECFTLQSNCNCSNENKHTHCCTAAPLTCSKSPTPWDFLTVQSFTNCFTAVAGKRLTTTEEDNELFHRKLKESVLLRKYTDVNDALPESLEEKGKQLKEFVLNLKSHQRMQTYIKCLMGRNLSSMRSTVGKKNFIERALQYLPHSYAKSEIHFMINLYLLCEMYPRLSFVTVPIRELKAKFKLIRHLVSGESGYWKDTN